MEDLEKAKKVLRSGIALVKSDMRSIREASDLENSLTTMGATILNDNLDEEGQRLLEELQLLFKERKRLWLQILMDDYS